MKRLLLIGLLLLVAACGGDDGSAEQPADGTTAPASSSSTVGSSATTVPPATTSPAATVPNTTVGSTTTQAATASSGGLLAVRQAAQESAAFTSARFEGTLSASSTDGISEPFTVFIEGATDGTVVELRMDMSEALSGIGAVEGIDPAALGDFSDVRFIFDGETSYMKFPVFAMFGVTTDWVELPADQAAATAGVQGIDGSTPMDSLEQYTNAGGDVTDLGRETVRGVETTHYQVRFDTDDLEALGNEDARQMAAAGIEDFPMDVWIGDDGLIYRYAFALGGIPEVDDFSLTYDIYDYGENVIITLPDPDNVTPFSSLAP